MSQAGTGILGRLLSQKDNLEAPSGSEARTPTKGRSLSDSAPTLAPSPRFHELASQTTQDDQALPATTNIATPGRGLKLDLSSAANTFAQPAPKYLQSPQLECRDPYGSPPNTVLPRHSRGMDFSRAATHLHHSTLADQPSPESSPTITHKSLASRRTSSHSMALDSPRINAGWSWNSNSNSDKGFFSRSVGSTNAVVSSSSSSDSGEDMDMMEQDETEDPIMGTPQVQKSLDGIAVTPYGTSERQNAIDWLPQHSPNPNAFTHLRDRRRRKHGPGSIGRRSRLTTPDPQPQSARRDSIAMSSAARDHPMRSPMMRRDSRRESLSMGTNHLHITSSNESGDESGMFGAMIQPGVVRRPVVRRSNMLPKPKGFARIRAALQEESTPMENDVKREAEVVKQVHQNYKDNDWSIPSAGPPSPNVMPKPRREESSVSMSDMDFFTAGNDDGKVDPDHDRRVSDHKEFWPNLYNRMQTPPPLGRPRSSSNMSEDMGMAMDSPYISRRSTPPSGFSQLSAASSIPKPSVEAPMVEARPEQKMPTAAEITQKVNNKRRRDEDFDIASIKRRAVSPGMSVQSSPVPGQSPANGGGWWGQPPQKSREGTLPSANVEERAGSVGQITPQLGPKRSGLHPMTDTSDGLMKMSIE